MLNQKYITDKELMTVLPSNPRAGLEFLWISTDVNINIFL